MRVNRYERRHTLKTEGRRTVYLDNKGFEYDYKFIAQLSSFHNMVFGMLKNGFPVVVPRLWYQAWAFYPFFFVRKNISEDALTVLNHERIHVRQQRDIHLVFGLPLIVWSFWVPALWVIIPFVPMVFYYLDILRVLIMFRKTLPNRKFDTLRKLTCFEAEAISRSTNLQYLYNRKFFAIVDYTGINFKRKRKNGR